MPEPWTIEASRITYQDAWLRVRSDRCRTPAGRVVEPFHVLEYPTWVNVVALTPVDEIVLVREYRHGAGRVLLGLPAGTMDAAEDDPADAARRELREETGYVGGRLVALGSGYANPANQDNRVHDFLALGVRRGEAQALDDNEEIEVVTEDFVAFLGRYLDGGVDLQVSHATCLLLAAQALMVGEGGELGRRVRDVFLRPRRQRCDHP